MSAYPPTLAHIGPLRAICSCKVSYYIWNYPQFWKMQLKFKRKINDFFDFPRGDLTECSFGGAKAASR